MTAIALLLPAACALCAASGVPVRFTAFILPFLPALVGVVLALVVEAGTLWAGRNVQANWWFAMAFVAIAVFWLIWDSWSRGVPMAALADTMDERGLQFRMSLLGFGVAVIGTVLGMTYVGVRVILESMPTVGVIPGIVRLLPVLVIPGVLTWHVLGAIRVFEGVPFRLFL